MLAMVTIAFAVSYIPWMAFTALQLDKATYLLKRGTLGKVVYTIEGVSFFFFFFNCAVNPIIYTCMNTEFRNRLRASASFILNCYEQGG